MNLNKPINFPKIKIPKPIKSIWSYIGQWIKTWFYVLLLSLTTWPVFIFLTDLVYHPDDSGCGLFLLCGRELGLFVGSAFFANWFWVGFLTLKRFSKIWQRVLSVMIFLLAQCAVFLFDLKLFIYEWPTIVIGLVSSGLIYFIWQKYAKKIKQKDLYQKAIVITKKVVILILIKIGVNLLMILGVGVPNNFLSSLLFVLMLVIVVVLFRKFYTKIIAVILTLLLLVAIGSTHIFQYPVVSLTVAIVMLLAAILDGIMVIKKQKNTNLPEKVRK